MFGSIRSRKRFSLATAGVLLLVCMGCGLKVQEKALVRVDDLAREKGLDGKSPWLKAHLPNGGLYLLSNWQVDESRRVISGDGMRMDARRDVVATGPFVVSLDSVAIFESNVVQTSGVVAGLTVLSVASAGMTVYCITNPKACFGSCPTYYAANEAGEKRLMAEGFSASVAPALEDSDLDALYHAKSLGDSFILTMTNEALETHALRHTDLLVAPRPPKGRVLALNDGTWVEASGFLPVSHCRGPEGDCTELLTASDGRERYSLADSLYLGTRECLELAFS